MDWEYATVFFTMTQWHVINTLRKGSLWNIDDYVNNENMGNAEHATSI